MPSCFDRFLPTELLGLNIPSAAAGSLANKRSLLRNALFCCTLTPYEHKCSTGFGVQQKAMRFASPFCLRKVRDSNPRNPEGFNRFRVCPVRPLRQLSAAKLHNYSELMTIKTIFFAAVFLFAVFQKIKQRLATFVYLVPSDIKISCVPRICDIMTVTCKVQ